MYDDLVEFLQESVTPFHAAAIAESWLRAAGFTRLEEADYWNLEPGKGYYTTRNGSSVVAWRVPQHAIGGWRIVASHSDSPSWKIKADTVENDGCRRLSVEGYGGMIMSTWLDRPLTVGGRALVKTEDGIESRLVYLDRDLLVIPSLAIHFQRDINKGHTFNPQVDMQPLWGPAGSRTLTDLVAESLGVEAADILDSDLQLVTRQAPTQIGARTVRVVNVERKEAREQPPLLYDLTTLQKEANSRYGFSAEKTLDIAQSLYEKKFITYPRTGSRYISEDVAEEIPALIGNMTRYPRFAEYAGRMDTASLSRRSVDNEKIADHHALLPTENLPSELDADHRIVYEMVAGRMLETFSGACVKENTSLTLQSAGHDFTARGSIMVETGWRAVLNEPVEEKEEDMTLLPDIVQGDELPVKGCVTEQKQTRPRPLHTESSLLAAMETAGRELSDEAEREAMKDAGIGTPATRAAIIETLFAREYVRREKKSLVPTDKGLAVYAVVRDKKIADVAMTGGWELALSKIATGEMDAPTFHRGIEVFASQIAKELLEARIDGAESDTACPRCGRPVVFYPKLAKCQNPDCGLTVWRTVARKELTDKQLAELLTKGKTGTIRGFVKNGGGTFDAALTLDDQFKTSFVFEPRDTPRQGKRNKRK